jgi:hypothetical protein
LTGLTSTGQIPVWIARRVVAMPDEAIGSIGKPQILHGGEERFGLHLNSLGEQPPRARPEDVRLGIIDLALLTKPNNIAILVHGV